VRKLTDAELRSFLSQVLAAESVFFPQLAIKLGFNWFKQIKPRLSDAWFREEFDETLEVVKFSLIQRMHETALKGTLPGKVPPAAVHIKEMIKLIDSGALLGRARVEKEESTFDPEQEAIHRKRLGIE
jgi:hypothetical protein